MGITRYARCGIEQTSFGGGSSKIVNIRPNSIGFRIDRGLLFDETIDNYFRADADAGALQCSGSLEMKVRPSTIGEYLYALFGDVTTTTNDPEPGLNTHEFTLDEPKSLYQEIGENDILWELYGVGITSGEFNFEAKEYVNFRADYIAKEPKVGTFSAPTIEESKIFTFDGVYVEVDDVKVADVRSAKISIDRKIDADDFVLDDFKLDDLIVNGIAEITGEFVVKETQLSELRTAIFGDDTSIELLTNKVAKPKLEIIGVVTEDSLENKLIFETDDYVYKEGSWDMTGRDRADRTLPFEIIGDSFKATLINQITSYPQT